MSRTRQYHLAPLSDDPALDLYSGALCNRSDRVDERAGEIAGLGATGQDLLEASRQHEWFGLHRTTSAWTFREWAPNATTIYLVGDATDWQERPDYQLERGEYGQWSLELPPEALAHAQHYKLSMHWDGGQGFRLPAYARRVVQNDYTKIFCAQVWDAPAYEWQHAFSVPLQAPLIYESHIGMAQETPGVGTYLGFRDHVLPRIVAAGYNTIQLMAIAEHPYYGSFGYHVANFFAPSSRFGTPEELKSLVDRAHELGLTVIIDLVHSHSVKNEDEGLGNFDGTQWQYFHDGPRGMHEVWDSRCFDYSKPDVLRFLLSNCRYWLEEFKIDGYRFDGITSMLYTHHGLGVNFVHYDQYFDGQVDVDAYAYLALANKVIHTLRPDAITIAEDMSGMPGLGAPAKDGGAGFDYRLAMGVPDIWFDFVKKLKDEEWHLGHLWYELTNRRQDEQSISYVESHDQAIVGAKTFAFELIGSAMYDSMGVGAENMIVDRGIALHKMARTLTMFATGDGYLNFMGNEFGHPEWIDFPREGNGWSYQHARRQWSLADRQDLRFHQLAAWDRACVGLIQQHRLISDHYPEQLMVHDDDLVLAVRRGPAVVICNSHPVNSYTDYAVQLPPGEYQLAINSDEARFGGHARLTHGQRFFTQKHDDRTIVQLYLPNRTLLVLLPVDQASA
ncbi:MAG TPA: 1,4-alpha-glucan-branching enzyme [Lentisphaeria bacterium]|jgi:1,4-alpha-glucan branching enzyme|nr:1,4-alpha-glucan-branching enzyme [Lentisphaeria bacterium]